MHVWIECTYAWHWLYSVGFARDVVASVVGAVVAAVFAFFLGFMPWRRHRKSQMDIADKLDVTTPGGLRDVALLLKAILKETKDTE